MTELTYVPLNKLVSRGNPRGRLSNLEQLVLSIATVGLRTPLEVMPDEESEGKYRVLSGHRRRSALSSLKRQGVEVPDLNYNAIPCIVREAGDDSFLEDENDITLIQLASNAFEEIPPSQLGKAIKQALINGGWTEVDVANIIGIRPARARLLVQLTDAPANIRQKIDSGEMSVSAFHHWLNASSELREEIASSDEPISARQMRDAVRDERNAELNPGADDLVPESFAVVVTLNEIKDKLRTIVEMETLNVRERALLRDVRNLAAMRASER